MFVIGPVAAPLGPNSCPEFRAWVRRVGEPAARDWLSRDFFSPVVKPVAVSYRVASALGMRMGLQVAPVSRHGETEDNLTFSMPALDGEDSD